MSIHNPFNASRVKITKKVTRKHYESHPEKYGEYIYDADKDCDFNEHFCIVTNGVDYILIRENGKD